MLPKRLLPMAGMAALAAAAITLGQLHAFAFPSRSETAGSAGEFSPLFSRHLEIGVQRMDGPPDRIQVAGLQIYMDDSNTIIFSANPASYCLGSACLRSTCFGSACVGSQCLGSACTTSGCFGSLCGGSACLGSVCLGSACLGSACTGCTKETTLEETGV